MNKPHIPHDQFAKRQVGIAMLIDSSFSAAS
jgi:hypothetical protein